MANFFETPLFPAVLTAVGGAASVVGAGAGIDVLEGIGVGLVDAGAQAAEAASAQAAPQQAGMAAPAPTVAGLPRWVPIVGVAVVVVLAVVALRR